MKQITSNERALPLYQAGLAAGTDIGLRVALDALTQERIREGNVEAAYSDLRSPIAATPKPNKAASPIPNRTVAGPLVACGVGVSTSCLSGARGTLGVHEVSHNISTSACWQPGHLHCSSSY
jgi:hypothetical protein